MLKGAGLGRGVGRGSQWEWCAKQDAGGSQRATAGIARNRVVQSIQQEMQSGIRLCHILNNRSLTSCKGYVAAVFCLKQRKGCLNRRLGAEPH